MTEQEIVDLGPAFAAHLRRFRGHLGQDRTAKHFDTYCRGLLSDLSVRLAGRRSAKSRSRIRICRRVRARSKAWRARASLDRRNKSFQDGYAMH